jgi:hypothetical protein
MTRQGSEDVTRELSAEEIETIRVKVRAVILHDAEAAIGRANVAGLARFARWLLASSNDVPPAVHEWIVREQGKERAA